MNELPQALAPLAAYKQFMLYKKVPSATRPGKTDKFPCDIYGKVVTAHESQYWLDSTTAITAAKMFGEPYGVAFTFTENDPFFFVDLDDCATPGVGNGWSTNAQYVMNSLPGAAIEVSQSNQGLHIIGTYTQAFEHSCKCKELNADLYTKGRFVALTGRQTVGSASHDCTAQLIPFATARWPVKTASAENWSDGPVAEYTPISDEELLRKARAKKSVAARFGAQASFDDLWANNLEVLVGIYPNDQGLPGADDSRVDAAMAQHLAFWTGNDCARIERLMRESALVRDKWDERPKYLMDTILGAVGMQETVYTGGKKQREPTESVKAADLVKPGTSVSREIQVMDSYQFMGTSEQLEHFDGCVYVASGNVVINKAGQSFKQDQFNVWYGGYEFAMDHEQRKTTRKAWEAFNGSLGFKTPKAHKTCFRPLQKPGEIIDDNGTLMLNTYVEVNTPRQAGDVTPFLDHVKKLLPDERDQKIVLSYMAACVQHKGHKFQWAPLIQGAEGNGKSMLSRCVAFAISNQYTATPQASEIGEKFNEWIVGKLFIGVEDIYLPDHKREVIEVLKPMISNDRMAIRAMGRAQEDNDNYANFIFNSNHRDAIRKTKDDRRFAVFYTAQQSKKDIDACGMGGSYFPMLYKWLKIEGGYAVVNEFLNTYVIEDEFNPAVESQRAPDTSSTSEAIRESLTLEAQYVLEAIEEGLPGFSDDLICSKATTMYLESHKLNVQPAQVKSVLKSIGFKKHVEGMEGDKIYIDKSRRPSIYVKVGSEAEKITSKSELKKHIAHKDLYGLMCPIYPNE